MSGCPRNRARKARKSVLCLKKSGVTLMEKVLAALPEVQQKELQNPKLVKTKPKSLRYPNRHRHCTSPGLFFTVSTSFLFSSHMLRLLFFFFLPFSLLRLLNTGQQPHHLFTGIIYLNSSRWKIQNTMYSQRKLCTSSKDQQ